MSEERTARTPPRNEEAERALLGALLLDDERVAEVADLLRPEDFYDRRHARVFEGILRLAERNTPVNFVSLGETLRAAGTFAEIGGAAYLVQLAQDVTSSAHALHHAHIVADTAALRGLIREATEIITQAYETRADGESVKEIMDLSEQRIFQLARREAGKGAEPIASAIKETFRRIEASAHREGLTGLTSGFLDLDQLLCGLNAGDLIVLAARPSMGKTALALNIIEHAAMLSAPWSCTSRSRWDGNRSSRACCARAPRSTRIACARGASRATRCTSSAPWPTSSRAPAYSSTTPRRSR